jgi:FkbM family methyltransferase
MREKRSFKFIEYFHGIVNSKNPFKYALAEILCFTKICEHIIFKKDDLKFRFYPTTTLSFLWKDRSSLDNDLLFFKLFLRPGDIFVDVGANIGLVSLTAAQIVGRNGRVVAIEGFPKTYFYLEKILKLNALPNIKTYNYIIGSENSYASFVEKIDDSASFVYADKNGKIPVRRLDSIINFENIDLLKIDVEGYEKYVLLGSYDLLNGVNTIYFESSQYLYSRYNYSLDDIIDILENFNFKIFSLNEANKTLAPVKKGYSPKFENLIATKNYQKLVERTNLRLK